MTIRIGNWRAEIDKTDSGWEVEIYTRGFGGKTVHRFLAETRQDAVMLAADWMVHRLPPAE